MKKIITVSRKNIFILLLGFVLIGQIFSQTKNPLNNTTWECTEWENTTGETHHILQFAESGFKWTKIRRYGHNDYSVGTYEIQKENVTLSSGVINYRGILLGDTLTISVLGRGWEFYRVQSGANSQSNSKNNSGTQKSTSSSTAQDFINSGNTYYDKGDYDRAIVDYTQAIKLDPNYNDAYYNRGNAYFDKGDYNRAIVDYTQVIKLDPNNDDAYYNRGNTYYNKRDYNRAIADYTQAININPNYAKAYHNRGLVYKNKSDYDRAITDYNQAIKLNPNDAIAYFNRGLVFNIKGDKTRAIVDFETALKLDPNDTEARNILKKLRGY